MTAVAEVLEEIRRRVAGLPGISGVGATKSSPQRIVVYVDEKTPEIEAGVPKNIAGYDVVIEETHGGVVAL